MTMQHESHPHDERLAALSAADPDATGDAALREHVTGCERCRALVDDLAVLRAALAELPDLRPSRPLQLLPPVAERAAAAGGPFGLLRRLSAPAMAVGVVMILIGAVGAVGSAGSFQAVFSNVGTDLSAGGPLASEAEDSWFDRFFTGLGGAASAPSPAAAERTTPGVVATDSLGPRATYGSPRAMMTTPPPGDDEGREGDEGSLADLDSSGPAAGGLVWLALLVAGAVIAGGGLLIRFAVQPRAG